MFVSDQLRLPVGFHAAQARLASLINGDSLLTAALDAYGDPGTALVLVGPVSPVPIVSRLVKVHFRDLVTRGDCAILTLRWEATGPGGGLFPALDADITLAPDGAQATVLTLNGAYRPPLGSVGAGLDRAVLHRVATATIRVFLKQVADAIAHPASATERVQEVGELQPLRLPADPASW